MPQQKSKHKFKSISVIGTNGKGSVSYKIAYALQKSGYKVGLFTSPHLLNLTERIQVNFETIPFDFFKEYLCKIPYEGNWFYHLFNIAVEYFNDMQVDFAVFEAGIGAKKDPIRFLEPLITVFTSLSLDHQDVLGHTLESIAMQKGATLNEKSWAVVSEQALTTTLLTLLLKNRSKYAISKKDALDYQKTNTHTAMKAIDVLIKQGIPVHPQQFNQLYPIAPLGRFQSFEDDVYLDVAHNIEGMESALIKLQQLYPEKNVHLVIGGYKDKNFLDCLKQVKNASLTVYVDGVATDKRMMPKLDLFLLCKQLNQIETRLEENPIENALLLKKKGEPMLITGGFLMVQKALKFFSGSL